MQAAHLACSAKPQPCLSSRPMNTSKSGGGISPGRSHKLGSCTRGARATPAVGKRINITVTKGRMHGRAGTGLEGWVGIRDETESDANPAASTLRPTPWCAAQVGTEALSDSLRPASFTWLDRLSFAQDEFAWADDARELWVSERSNTGLRVDGQ